MELQLYVNAIPIVVDIQTQTEKTLCVPDGLSRSELSHVSYLLLSALCVF